MKDTLLALPQNYLAAPVPGSSSVSNIPQPKSGAPSALADAVNTVLGIAAWAGTVAGVAGIIITGIMMSMSMKRGESSEHFSRLGMVMGGCVLVATAGPIVEFLF
ncbi:hypothetical protein ACFFS2_08785 [Streptomyces aurantiacus]|uniref:Uncharacterized protein n=1 Tax=Streptomyces aurantiacus TaxID=47760 RepID=A0A7G1NQJ4_9ACTN|nr:hypothetical protein [Streptomyces aurantiacus]MDQ0772148.1 type IV secretory pathway VirB2 component (pilin) [Streptomyces aurantiacus]BCL25523.1 hypothetical protein GCM10017557_03820 [Streptomyces aurantiacus]